MAVFGVQFVITLVMSSFLSKVLPYYSLGDWLLCNTGLKYFLHPTDEQLREKKRSKDKNGVGDTFFVTQKYMEVDLQKAPVIRSEVVQLRYFPDYQWLIDFSFCTALIYSITEIYVYLNPAKEEVNLSMVWCLLLLLLILKVFLSVTLIYFKASAEDGEKALVILALFCYLLLAMMLLIINENQLELGLDSAYSAFNISAHEFIKTQEITSVGVLSKMSCKAVVAVLSAFLGACLAFPGLRLGKMHWDAVKMNENRRWLQLCLHASFIAPAVVILLWIRPLARHHLVTVSLPGYGRPLLSADCFSVVRVVAVLIACMLRLLVLPVYLQSYLDMAKTKLEEQKNHAGKITNKQIQKQVASVYYYLCVVTLQYLLPLLLSAVLALMLKTLGGYSWASLMAPRGLAGGVGSTAEAVPSASAAKPSLLNLVELSETTQSISLGFEQLRKLLVPQIWEGLLSFSLWWTLFVWFISGLFGLFYQKYFTIV